MPDITDPSSGIVNSGQSASGVTTGTPEAPNNTGRDWGQAAEIGAVTLGTVIGSILSWGTAAPALTAADVALAAGTIGADAYQDVQQNKQQAQAAQRNQQGQLDAQRNQRPGQAQVELPNALKSAANPMAGASVGSIGATPLGPPKTSLPPGTFSPMQVQATAQQDAPVMQLPEMSSDDMTGTSDRRAKMNIKDGSAEVSEFLDKVRRSGAWPKSIKDPR